MTAYFLDNGSFLTWEALLFLKNQYDDDVLGEGESLRMFEEQL